MFSSLVFSFQNIQLSAGSYDAKTFDTASQYTIKAEHVTKHGLGFDFGLSLVQSSLGNKDMTQITAPFAEIKQYVPFLIPTLNLYLGVGFSLNNVPSEFGKNYVGYHGNLGLTYSIQKQYFFVLNYTSHTGKTLNDGNGHKFDATIVSFGIGFMLNKPNKNHKKTLIPTQPSLKRPLPNRRPRNKRNKPSEAYKKTQKVMQGMSWPSY